ncbi:hypothetical protein K461DRAFT_51713 [Myriangium duriaei CBS 260.36]|uniref:MICOS complex subunit MIC60 n=1 Tax=Myriangium duriaei CBS 260.36 TaxID=1168546 RepID=A0A9P4IS51_9PEZI|nr:hypothetical protein K461DRAFT_51713 [Myriangium duriaei CBS 260.36]
MLRAPLARSRLVAIRPSYGLATAQWQINRPRYFADTKKPDQTVLPGTQSNLAATSTTPPALSPTPPPPTEPLVVPPTPPKPEDVQAGVPPTTVSGTGPTIALPPPPKKKSGRLRRFFTTLLVLGTLGYAGGVYYSLVNDNFHDFFTEYVPGGEDAVAYFEEREFRKRFPTRPVDVKSYPQVRGESKVTVTKQSGVTARAASKDNTSDLGKSGRHSSAKGDSEPAGSQKRGDESSKLASKNDAKTQPKKESAEQKSSEPAAQSTGPTPATSPETSSSLTSSPSSTTSLIDHVAVPNAAEPVVQAAVKMVNDLITAINNDPNATKYGTTLAQAKTQLSSIIESISTLKQQIQHDAEEKVSNAHQQFDTAAKELVSRLEREMQEQELRWREEYESEREKISQSYQSKLSAELSSAEKLAEQRTQNALLEQQIALQRSFGRQVQDRVETERSGRLGKLEALSSSVEELERLTADWNSVISSNLATQHLHVALESVRAAIARYDHPTPFVSELSALKELANSNSVVDAAIASIPPAAYQRGLPSPAHLIDRFRRVATEVRKASLLPEDAGVASHAASAVLSRFVFSKKSEGLPAGDDVEAVLTRTEVLLEEGDLDGAAREMNGLHGWAGVLSRDWVGECRRVLETRQALDVSTSLPFSSMDDGLIQNRSLLLKPGCRVCSSSKAGTRFHCVTTAKTHSKG